MNLKEPSFITPDPKRPEDMFMIGRYHGKGSVMSFKKIDGEIKWHAQFETISTINAFSQAGSDGLIYLCGHYQPNEATDTQGGGSSVNYKAVIARMSDDGEV